MNTQNVCSDGFTVIKYKIKQTIQYFTFSHCRSLGIILTFILTFILKLSL